MKQCYPLFGLVPIINTPFDDRDRIDYASIGRLIEQTIGDGISGAIVPAVASEVDKLSLRERKEYVAEVVRLAAGRIRIVAGVSSDSLNASMELAEQALTDGSDGILCRAPDAIQHNPQAVQSYFLELAQVDMPMLMIQDLAWYGPGLPLEVILELFDQIESFRCLKVETVPAGYKYTQVLEATQGRMNVSGGWAIPQMIEALDRGVHAFNTTAVNKPFAAIFRLHRSGHRAEAVELFDRIVPYLAWVHQHIDISIHFLKRYCFRRGLFSTVAVREPILPYDRFHEQCGNELLERIIALEDELDLDALPTASTATSMENETATRVSRQ